MTSSLQSSSETGLVTTVKCFMTLASGGSLVKRHNALLKFAAGNTAEKEGSVQLTSLCQQLQLNATTLSMTTFSIKVGSIIVKEVSPCTPESVIQIGAEWYQAFPLQWVFYGCSNNKIFKIVEKKTFFFSNKSRNFFGVFENQEKPVD